MRRRLVSDWSIQLTWFVAGVFATGALWYFLSRGEYSPAIISAASAGALAAAAVYLQRINDRSARFRMVREQLSDFLKEAEGLALRADEQPLPIAEHNAWVSNVEAFLSEVLDSSYATRFSNFSGMTLFATSNQNSGFKVSLEARSRRLHEFIVEFSQ